jgi:hypothetical protein
MVESAGNASKDAKFSPGYPCTLDVSWIDRASSRKLNPGASLALASSMPDSGRGKPGTVRDRDRSRCNGGPREAATDWTR